MCIRDSQLGEQAIEIGPGRLRQDAVAVAPKANGFGIFGIPDVVGVAIRLVGQGAQVGEGAGRAASPDGVVDGILQRLVVVEDGDAVPILPGLPNGMGLGTASLA